MMNPFLEVYFCKIKTEFMNMATFTLKRISYEYTIFILEQLAGLRGLGSPTDLNTLNLLTIPEKTTKDSSLKSATFTGSDFRGFYFFRKFIFLL